MRGRLLLCAALTALSLLLGASPAAAAEAVSHPFLEKLTGGPEYLGSRPPHPFEDACGFAEDSDGDHYVADYHHDTIDVFGNPQYFFLTTIKEVDPGNGPCALAVDGAGNVYVDNWHEDVVKLTPDSFPPDQFTTYTQTTIDASDTATGLALNNQTGRLYVDDGTYVSAYEPSGEPVQEGGQPLRIGLDESAEYFGLALDESNGDLYLADAATKTVKAFEPMASSTPVTEIDGAGTPQGGFAYLGDAALTVDNSVNSPSFGHLFVVDDIQRGVSEHPEAVLDEFNAAAEYRGQIARWIVKEGEPKVPVEYWLTDPEPAALAISAKGEVLITNGNEEGSALDVFGPTAPGEPLAVSKTGAGTVTSQPAGVNCGSACSAEYDEGSEVKLTATPDRHSEFAGWSGCASVPTSTICRVTMSSAKAVVAQFTAIPQQTLTVTKSGGGVGTVVSEPAGIECGASCTEHFNEGSTVTLTAVPAPHSRFGGWSGPGCDESTQLTCQLTMSEAKALNASFETIPQLPLEVAVSGPGSVSSDPVGISCGDACAEDFDEGSTVTLTATPTPHSEVSWNGCSALPSPSECTVTMGAAEAVGAVFSPIHHSLAVTIAGSGSVSASVGAVSGCGVGGSCTGTYVEGETLTLSAAPTPGSAFAGWAGACGGTGPCHITIGADTAVTANFVAIPPPPVLAPPRRVTFQGFTARGGAGDLKLSVSAPGSVIASGKGLQTARANAAAAGSLTLHLALSKGGKRALTGRGKLKVTVAVTFTPSGGGAAVIASKALTFEAREGPRFKRKLHSRHKGY